jgi:outer membrane protein assembly factor BamB
MVHSSATLDAGALYIGSGDGRLYALDARTGEERWRFPTGHAISSTPAVAEGLVFVGTRDNAFWALDARSGKQRWRLKTGADLPLPWGFETGDLYTSSPAYAGGVVYFRSGDGQVYAVDAGSGKVRWRFATPVAAAKASWCEFRQGGLRTAPPCASGAHGPAVRSAPVLGRRHSRSTLTKFAGAKGN